MFTKIGDPSGVAFSQHQLGTISEDQGNFAEAARLFDQSLQTRAAIGDKRGKFLSLAQLGRLKQLQGNFREALEFYTAANREMPGWRSENARKVEKWIAEIQQIAPA